LFVAFFRLKEKERTQESTVQDVDREGNTRISHDWDGTSWAAREAEKGEGTRNKREWSKTGMGRTDRTRPSVV